MDAPGHGQEVEREGERDGKFDRIVVRTEGAGTQCNIWYVRARHGLLNGS
jgi:hypothetical protein